MARRIPQGLRWLGGVAVVAWAAAELGVVANRTQGGDIGLALYFGIACLLLALVLEWRPVQTRIPFLRPAAHDLSRVLQAGDHLRESMPPVSDLDPAKIEEWRHRVRAWNEDARQTVVRHAPDREHWFVRGLPAIGEFSPDDWYTDLRRQLDPRIERLEELLKEQR